jgi:hypothetical protein
LLSFERSSSFEGSSVQADGIMGVAASIFLYLMRVRAARISRSKNRLGIKTDSTNIIKVATMILCNAIGVHRHARLEYRQEFAEAIMARARRVTKVGEYVTSCGSAYSAD